MKFPRFRGILEIKLFKVVVAEGEGTNEDPIREVNYFINEKGEIKFIKDPFLKKEIKK